MVLSGLKPLTGTRLCSQFTLLKKSGLRSHKFNNGLQLKTSFLNYSTKIPEIGATVSDKTSVNSFEKSDNSVNSETYKDSSTAKKTKKRGSIVFNNKNPSLQDFITAAYKENSKDSLPSGAIADEIPYLTSYSEHHKNLERDEIKTVSSRKYFTEVYGCQMNVSDAEILASVMNSAGYEQTLELEKADIVFLVTCSIRDAAEVKIWHRLSALKKIRRPHHPQNLPPTVGVLGCMAERLKEKLLENEKLVDLVCGPDAYRSIPHLISLNETSMQGVANVILSADETYADIVPVRRDESSRSVFLSIMRGCNNMCSYCIVPFTRGIERSRPIDSIVEEAKRLSDQGVKEIVLLGQNVNSYRDTTANEPRQESIDELSNSGFRTLYKRKEGGLRFAELVDRVAEVNPEIRIRFTSPHPKDFPDSLLDVIKRHNNVCNSLHLPAQSGNTVNLERMRRGYSREAYLDLVKHVRELIPDVSLSSDFITGFCGETEEEHQDTLSLMQMVEFDMAYMFAYSLREKTHAHRRFTDDVPAHVKQRRLQEIISVFHQGAQNRLNRLVGVPQLVLIDGPTLPRHQKAGRILGGRTEGNHRAFLFKDPNLDSSLYNLKTGDYVTFLPTSASSTSVTGVPLGLTSLQDFYKNRSAFSTSLSSLLSPNLNIIY